MLKRKVKFDPVVTVALNNLIPILLDNGYFATREYAKKYVDSIIIFCLSIPTRVYRTSSNPRYASYFCQYKPNRRTTWYILFDIENQDYLIRNIFNNHSPEYPQFYFGVEVNFALPV